MAPERCRTDSCCEPYGCSPARPSWRPTSSSPSKVFAFSAVANHKHTVIQVCSTSRVVKNSATVELESALVCLNCNRDRLLGHCLLQCCLISGWHISVTCDCHDWRTSLFARACDSAPDV